MHRVAWFRATVGWKHAYVHHEPNSIRDVGFTVVELGEYVNGGGCSFFQWADDEMSDRAKTVILNLLQENKKYKDVKTENEHPGGNLMAYALVGSWVFFIAMWLSVHK
ncbi:hypothetical protein ACS0TY_006441 [Phlomoides rotata]